MSSQNSHFHPDSQATQYSYSYFDDPAELALTPDLIEELSFASSASSDMTLKSEVTGLQVSDQAPASTGFENTISQLIHPVEASPTVQPQAESRPHAPSRSSDEGSGNRYLLEILAAMDQGQKHVHVSTILLRHASQPD